jgi:dTDP-4-amino-4,6-dideoxygalactose transaminase
MIPFVDLKPQHKQIKKQLLEAWEEILDCTGFVGGPWVDKLESRFGEMCGGVHCTTVSSGTDALEVALRALGVKPGDEVILPANTFIATAEAVLLIGAVPVLVDCKRGTWNIDPHRVEEAITGRTAGIIGVHLYGQPCDVDALNSLAEKHSLWVLEDSAQAHFATYKGRVCGSLANAAAFSFYPGKNLGATGEGGAITTTSDKVAQLTKGIRNHGSTKKYVHDVLGNNSRMSSVIAAALAIKLKYILEWTEQRRKNAALYTKLLTGTPGVELPVVEGWASPVWHLFVIHLDNPAEAHEYLKENGVASGFHYPLPLHLQNVFKEQYGAKGEFPNAEYNASHCLSLPMYAELSEEQIEKVCNVLKQYLLVKRNG